MTQQKVRINKLFSFETAHALEGYHGKCQHIHGHSYELQVSIMGFPIPHPCSTIGMVMDFSDLKKIVNTHIKPLFDHRLILAENSRFKSLIETDDTVRLVSYQPTCENMMLEMKTILQQHLQSDISLVYLKLQETKTSFTEWLAADN